MCLCVCVRNVCGCEAAVCACLSSFSPPTSLSEITNLNKKHSRLFIFSLFLFALYYKLIINHLPPSWSFPFPTNLNENEILSSFHIFIIYLLLFHSIQTNNSVHSFIQFTSPQKKTTYLFTFFQTRHCRLLFSVVWVPLFFLSSPPHPCP